MPFPCDRRLFSTSSLPSPIDWHLHPSCRYMLTQSTPPLRETVPLHRTAILQRRNANIGENFETTSVGPRPRDARWSRAPRRSAGPLTIPRRRQSSKRPPLRLPAAHAMHHRVAVRALAAATTAAARRAAPGTAAAGPGVPMVADLPARVAGLRGDGVVVADGRTSPAAATRLARESWRKVGDGHCGLGWGNLMNGVGPSSEDCARACFDFALLINWPVNSFDIKFGECYCHAGEASDFCAIRGAEC